MRWLSCLVVLIVLALLGVAFVLFEPQIVTFTETYLTQRKAQQAIDNGQYNDAVTMLEKAVAKYPDELELKRSLALTLHRANKLDKAQIMYHKVLKQTPHDHMLRLSYARMLGQQKKYNGAIKQFSVLLQDPELHPNLQETVYNGLAHIYLQVGNPAKNPARLSAEKRHTMNEWGVYYASKALQQDNTQPMPWFNIGVGYQRIGLDKKAVHAFCQSYLLNPNGYENRYNLGLSLIELQEYDEGFRQLRESTMMLRDQGHPDEAGKLAEVIQGVRNAVELDSNHTIGLTGKPGRIPTDLDPRCVVPTNLDDPETKE